MKKKKTKGIDYSNEPRTMPDLLRMITEEYEKRQKEAQIKRDLQKANLIAAIQKEKELIELIASDKKIVENMEADFEVLEISAEAETRKQAEKGVLREADVKAGRITLKEFNQRGKYDKQILEEITQGVAKKLELANGAIRGKNLEILKIEGELYKCKSKIRGLVIQPGFFMLEVLKGIKEYGDEQMALFLDELPAYDVQIKGNQRKLWLTEGKSIYGGQGWGPMSAKLAKRICHNPILPADLIPKLRSELSGFDDNDTVSVHFYFKEHDVEARLIGERQKVITTSKPLKKIVSESKSFVLHGDKKNGKTRKY